MNALLCQVTGRTNEEGRQGETMLFGDTRTVIKAGQRFGTTVPLWVSNPTTSIFVVADNPTVIK